MVSCGGNYIEFLYSSRTLNSIIQILDPQGEGPHFAALAILLKCVETEMGSIRFYVQFPSAFLSLVQLVSSTGLGRLVPPRAVRALLMFPEPFMDIYGNEVWIAVTKALSATPIVFDDLTRY